MSIDQLEGLGSRLGAAFPSLAPRGRGRGLRAAGIVLFAALAANALLVLLSRNAAPTRPGYLAAAVLLALVPWLTNALRLRIWGRFAGSDLGMRDAFRITVASDLGAALTPTAAGSGAVRLAMLLRRGLSAGRSSAVLLVMAAEDTLFFAAFLPAAFFLAPGAQGDALRAAALRAADRAGWVLLGAAALGLGSALLWRRARLGGLRARLRHAAGDARDVLALVVRRGKLRALVSLTLTAVQWIARYSVATAVLAAFGVGADPVLQILLQWAVFTAGTFVPTPGGAGAVEGAFAALYAPFVPGALLGAVTAAWRCVLFYLVVALDVAVLAGFVLARRPRRSRTLEARRTSRSWSGSSDDLAAPVRKGLIP